MRQSKQNQNLTTDFLFPCQIFCLFSLALMSQQEQIKNQVITKIVDVIREEVKRGARVREREIKWWCEAVLHYVDISTQLTHYRHTLLIA